MTEQVVMRVLGEHRDQGIHGDGIVADGYVAWLRCTCGWQENVTIDDDVDPAFRAWDAHVAAELAAALREDGWLVEGKTTTEAGLWFDGGVFETYDNASEAQWAAEPGDVVVTRLRTRYPDHVGEWEVME